MSYCPPCDHASAKAQLDRLQQLRNDAKIKAKKEGWPEVAIVESPAGYAFICSSTDERATRLRVLEFIPVL